VTDYISTIKVDWQAEISSRLREIITEALPDVEERLQYGKPHYLKNGKYAFVIGTAKGWVSFTIFNAQTLETPDGLFEASENGDRKTIKIRSAEEADYDMLAKLIAQAVQ
jgi:hypothetical protein